MKTKESRCCRTNNKNIKNISIPFKAYRPAAKQQNAQIGLSLN
jgi:hypothetical protein